MKPNYNIKEKEVLYIFNRLFKPYHECYEKMKPLYPHLAKEALFTLIYSIFLEWLKQANKQQNKHK